MEQQKTNNPFLNTKQAAELLGVSISTIRLWVSLRKIKFYRRGNGTSKKEKIFFLKPDLLKIYKQDNTAI